MGLSGSLGSVMTKFFSMRSSVVARSIPCLMSLSLPSCSQLFLRSFSVADSSGAGASTCAGRASLLPTELLFPILNLPRNHPYVSCQSHGALSLSLFEVMHALGVRVSDD